MTKLTETDIFRLFTEFGAVLTWDDEEFRNVDDVAAALKRGEVTPEYVEGEEWRPIEGFAGRYSISSLGRVRRDAPAKGTRRGRVLDTYTTRTGYKQVRLTQGTGEKSASYFVHRLLALTFIPNPDELPFVRHLNDKSWDNRLENLAWGTQSDNMYDRVANGNHPYANRNSCGEGHPLSGDNLTTRSDTGSRICVICDKKRKREWYERNKTRND